METLYIVVVLAAVFLCSTQVQGSREKRNLYELAEMISEVDKHNALTAYNNYGCYCGWGGYGTPVDGIDACCQTHDNCYGNITAKIKDCSPKWDGYTYQVVPGSKALQPRLVHCGDKNNKRFAKDSQNNFVLNGKDDHYCRLEICRCDKGLTECLEQFKFTGKKSCPSKR
ncbi:basic phospholipase A2 sphenotoxin subunit B-like [Saccostrea echinata]|uniref:basic phospholipase A2 sphenotoxin subunit B-like n=1 Tax=Saccostrea echinata TaxID=191078 RepID=UPI002A836FBC|nr:basic phospholipase A2 sphenotoxin subunit B-like [Saccostrea echinata]